MNADFPCRQNADKHQKRYGSIDPCCSWNAAMQQLAAPLSSPCVISSKFQVWWNVTPYRLVHSYRRFEGSQFLHLQGQAVHVELTHLKLLTLTRKNSRPRYILRYLDLQQHRCEDIKSQILFHYSWWLKLTPCSSVLLEALTIPLLLLLLLL